MPYSEHTEEKVRKRFCPFGHIAAFIATAEERDDRIRMTRCAGNECAMWRTFPYVQNAGYCGLACKPEPDMSK